MKKLLFSNALFYLLICIINPYQLLAGNGQIMFVAKLNTGNEVPTVRGDALGLVTFTLSEDRKDVLIHGLFTNLTGPVIDCHIHQAAFGTNGPVLVDLTSYVSFNRIKAAFPIPIGLLQLAQGGQLYINVHTASHPSGEIRGQLTMMSEIIIPMYAAGVNQVPPGPPNAYGLGTLRFSQNLTRLQYQILPIGLSGPVTAAHIHQGAVGVNGPVIVGLNAGEFITGTIEDTFMVRTVYNEILSGNAYINVHTTLNPNGEIRAQLSPDVFNNGGAILNGDQEIPPVTTTALAYGYVAINPTMDSIKYTLLYKGIVPISAHIHQAAAGIEGPPIISINTSFPGISFGISILTEDQLTSFLKDELYFNIHSAANPGGEIRGQIENNLMNSFGFDLCGDQEVPKKTVNAYGAAYVAINKANTEMDYGIIADGTNGDATATRLYDGAFGSNGTTLLNLDLPNPYTTKVVQITGTVAAKLDADRGYINIHNAANPTGEIRGQVRRSLSCIINTSNNETEIQNISLIHNVIDQTITIEAELERTMNANVVLTDISGKPIQQWKTNFPAGTGKFNYNVETVSSGFYLLNLIEGNKIMGAFKFVKF